MTDSRYGSSFIITVIIYTLIALLYLSFADEITPLKKPEPKPQVVRIALVSPVTKKAIEKIKKVEPKIEKPKPKKKKVIKKKVVVKKEIVKKEIVKVKKEIVKKPPPPPKKIPKEIIPPPIIEEIVYEPIIEPIYEPPPPPVVYAEIPPEEIYYEELPVYVPPPVITAKAEVAQQQYIIHDPIVTQAAPPPQEYIATPQETPVYAPPPQNHAVESDLSNEKRAFKEATRNIINANKQYPKMAKRRHIQGTVHVTFDILNNGDIFNIRTSGASTILQKAARKSVMQSSPLNVPSVLQSQFPMNNVSVNIDFRLE